MSNKDEVFKVMRQILIERTGKGFVQSEVDRLDAAFEGKPSNALTARMLLELFSHEAIVLEAYKDSENVWTVFGGLTAVSGVNPLDYKDKPASLEVGVTKTFNRIRDKYAREVVAAFGGRSLTEAQFAAALSFHWNTGAIGSATWVKSFLAGNVANARLEFMNWRKPASIIERREKERDLFFDGKWTNDGRTTVLQVNKPSYYPRWSSATKVDIKPILEKLLG